MEFKPVQKYKDSKWLEGGGEVGGGELKTQQSLGDEWDFSLDSIAVMRLTIRFRSNVSLILDAGGKILTNCFSQY